MPDPDFLCWTEGHTNAFMMLRYGLISGAPITVMTGEIGAGKTTLLRKLLAEADDSVVIGLISNMLPESGRLLEWAMMALGETVAEESHVKTFQRFQDLLISTYAAGRRVVLIIDEAQNLTVRQLEELRMLSNINADKDQLLQLVLVGQPQLRTLLRAPELTQFAQRVVLDCHLPSLTLPELERYIGHRLEVAGAKWRIFPLPSIRLIHVATGGVPRLANVLCDFCLVYAYAADANIVDEALVREFLTESRRRGVFEQFAALPGAPSLAAQT